MHRTPTRACERILYRSGRAKRLAVRVVPVELRGPARARAYTVRYTCAIRTRSAMNTVATPKTITLYSILGRSVCGNHAIDSRSADSLLSTRGAAATATRGTRLRKLRALILTELVKVRPQVFLLDGAPG